MRAAQALKPSGCRRGGFVRRSKGKRPSLSIEITRACPLRFPGCYTYDDAHLGGGMILQVSTMAKDKK
jgi:MoaA/NifB/PqqE/SkfB family radical SAM enzyme